jgi:hypothetical protein
VARPVSSNRSSKSSPAKHRTKPFCRNLRRPVRQLPPAVMADPRRVAAIIGTQMKWVNGTVLHYCFFTGGHFSVPKTQADAIRGAFS